ncbi:hypothetical protein Hanom_Chr11g00985661 [Helianthus anomalus]
MIRVISCAAEKNDEGTSGETSCLDKWVDDLPALRSRIEQALRDRLAMEPDNEVHRREGEMLKRTTGGTSSRPSAQSDIRMLLYAMLRAHVFYTDFGLLTVSGTGGGGGGNSVGGHEELAKDVTFCKIELKLDIKFNVMFLPFSSDKNITLRKNR